MNREEAVEIINRSNPEIDAEIAFGHLTDDQMIEEAMVILREEGDAAS